MPSPPWGRGWRAARGEGGWSVTILHNPRYRGGSLPQGIEEARSPVSTRLSRANVCKWPRSSIEQIRKKTSVSEAAAAKGDAAARAAEGQQRLAENLRHGPARVQEGHAVFQGRGVQVLAGLHRLGHLLGVPKPAGPGGQLDHRINHRVARPRRAARRWPRSATSRRCGFPAGSPAGPNAARRPRPRVIRFIGEPDPVLEPMMDVGLGEPPLARRPSGQAIFPAPPTEPRVRASGGDSEPGRKR